MASIIRVPPVVCCATVFHRGGTTPGYVYSSFTWRHTLQAPERFKAPYGPRQE